MTDREKVIKGLEYCQSACVPVDCECCPFGECSNAPHTLRITPEVHDAILSLLKAQAPKVLTLDELPGWDGAVWVEYSPAHLTKAGEWMFVDFVPTYMQNRSVYLYTRRGQMVSYAQYGVTWRAWTGRPSEEQMEAEAWE